MSWAGHTGAVAETCDAEPEHGLAPGEAAWWFSELAGAGVPPGAAVLDLGAGTGLLMSALRDHGFMVHGPEPSPEMVARGQLRDPSLTSDDFILADARQRAAVSRARYAAVVSRQVLCHIEAPDAVFDAVRAWLRPGGVFLAVDGFWPASAWSDADRAHQPFASLGDAAPVQRALERAGFEVVAAGPAGALNDIRQRAFPGTTPRYRVRALRPFQGPDQ